MKCRICQGNFYHKIKLINLFKPQEGYICPSCSLRYMPDTEYYVLPLDNKHQAHCLTIYPDTSLLHHRDQMMDEIMQTYYDLKLKVPLIILDNFNFNFFQSFQQIFHENCLIVSIFDQF